MTETLKAIRLELEQSENLTNESFVLRKLNELLKLSFDLSQRVAILERRKDRDGDLIEVLKIAERLADPTVAVRIDNGSSL